MIIKFNSVFVLYCALLTLSFVVVLYVFPYYETNMKVCVCVCVSHKQCSVW